MQDRTQGKNRIDLLTLVVISAFAYQLAIFLHEMGGHGLSCFLVGGHVLELGAFYVNCDYTGVTELAIRWVAFAGPFVSLLLGLISFVILGRIPNRGPHLKFFLWLLGALGLMNITGYLLFSGLSGLGDFGISRDGILYQVSPAWVWRTLETLVGAASYFGVAVLSARQMDKIIGGAGVDRIRRARRIALLAYLSGVIVALLISLLNPAGITIILISAAAGSLGGTSGLLWMMQFVDRKIESPVPPLQIPRSWPWIVVGLAFILVYAAVFGPTLHP